MNVFFDVDHTIQGDDGTLRPGVREVFQRLIDDGHTIYVWSGVGIRWTDVKRHNLEGMVADVFMKPIFRYEEAVALLPVRPDFIVDDHQEIVDVLGGIAVKPYWYRDDSDREMERVYQLIQEHHRNGPRAEGPGGSH